MATLYDSVRMKRSEKAIHRNWRQTTGCKVVGGEENKELNEHKVSSWSDEKVLRLNSWWVHKIVNVLNATALYTLKWLLVNSMLCELYLIYKKKAKGRGYCFVEVKIFPTRTE